MIRIVVCGSNSLLLAGLIAVVDGQSHLEIVGSFLDEIDLTFLAEKAVDLLLLEQTPNANWWQLEQWMLTTNRTIVGILLTDSLTTEEKYEYLDLGFLGFLPRSTNSEVLIAAIDAVVAGLIVIHPELTSIDENAPAITPLSQSEIYLTPRETEILQLLGEGLDNKAIANCLYISKHTVKFHISSIFSKLDVSSRTEAVTLGLRQRLIRL